MKPRTETFAKLDEFCRYPWFQNCGKPFDGNFVSVKSWSEVKKQVRLQRWEMLQGYFHHHGFVDPLQKGPRRGQKIREIFIDEELRAILHLLLFSIHQMVERYDWPSGLDGFGPITQSVQRDVTHALWEAEYSDMATPTAFSQTIQSIYRGGHIVAGGRAAFHAATEEILRDGFLMAGCVSFDVTTHSCPAIIFRPALNARDG